MSSLDFSWVKSKLDILFTVLFRPVYFLLIKSLTEAGREQKTLCKQCPFIRRPRSGLSEWLTGLTTSIRRLVHLVRQIFRRTSDYSLR